MDFIPNFLMMFLSDAWVKDWMSTHQVLITILSAIGAGVSSGGMVGAVLKVLAIISPTTGDNKVKTMLMNWRKV
jgi:hypothetical protein